MFVSSVSIKKKNPTELATAHVLHRTQRNALWWSGLGLNRAGSGNNKKKEKTGTRPNPEKNACSGIFPNESLYVRNSATVLQPQYIGSKAYPCTCSITVNNASCIPHKYRFTNIHFILN